MLGGVPEVAPPPLDALATRGTRFTNYYAAAPICSPSRAALLSGCYPRRIGLATACIGKWHLGDQPEFLPTRQGFDYYFGIPYSNDMGTVEDGSKSNPGQPKPGPNRRAAESDEYGLRGFNQPPLPLLASMAA